MIFASILRADTEAFYYYAQPDIGTAEVRGISLLKETFSIGEQVVIVQVGAEYGFCKRTNYDIKSLIEVPQEARDEIIRQAPAQFLCSYIAQKADKRQVRYIRGEVTSVGTSRLGVQYLDGNFAGQTAWLPVLGVAIGDFYVGEKVVIDVFQFGVDVVVGWWEVGSRFTYSIFGNLWMALSVDETFTAAAGTKKTLVASVIEFSELISCNWVASIEGSQVGTGSVSGTESATATVNFNVPLNIHAPDAFYDVRIVFRSVPVSDNIMAFWVSAPSSGWVSIRDTVVSDNWPRIEGRGKVAIFTRSFQAGGYSFNFPCEIVKNLRGDYWIQTSPLAQFPDLSEVTLPANNAEYYGETTLDFPASP